MTGCHCRDGTSIAAVIETARWMFLLTGDRQLAAGIWPDKMTKLEEERGHSLSPFLMVRAMTRGSLAARMV
jgi:hypothetical protein